MKKHLLLIVGLMACGSFCHVSAQLSANPDKFLGNITTRYNVDTDGFEYWTLWNQITPENESKWGSVEGTKGKFNWGGVDKCVNYANEHNFPFKFHAIIWGAQHPGWFNNSLSIYDRNQAIMSWMNEMKKHYDTIDLIDVANECVAGHQGDTYLFVDPLGGEGQTGWDWLVNAFKMAHEKWPEAILIYNDYNTFQWNTDQFISLVTALRDGGAPIDAYGCQSHDLTDCKLDNFKKSMDKLQNALKMPMYITEYDLGTYDDNHQKNQLADQFPLMWEADYCAGVTFWGWIYGATWTDDGNSGLIRNRVDRPAMTWLREYMASEAATNAKSPYPGMKKPISFYIQPERYKAPIGEPCAVNIEAMTHNGTTVEKVEFFVNDEKVATLTDAPYVYEYTPVDDKKANFKAIAYTSDGKTYERLGGMYGTKYPQGPFNGEPTALPGVLEAEDYDLGGEGISSHTSRSNASTTKYRDDQGNFGISTVKEGGYAVSGANAGDWMEYTVTLDASGTKSKKIGFEAIAGATEDNCSFTIYVYQGVEMLKPIEVQIPKTGRKQYTKVTGDLGRFKSGDYRIRIQFNTGDSFIDKLYIGTTEEEVNGIEMISIDKAEYQVFNLSGSCIGKITVDDQSEISDKLRELTGTGSLYILRNTKTGKTLKVTTK